VATGIPMFVMQLVLGEHVVPKEIAEFALGEDFED
jgi:hypothetical protein